MKHILSIDQGTTSCRAILFDAEFRAVSSSQKEFRQYFPQSGWVEHDVEEIWEIQYSVCKEAIEKSGVALSDIACIGITNQRETIVLWERETGKPVHKAIVWQDRRTAAICEEIKKAGLEKTIREKTGLVADAYFSATKIKWLLENIPGIKEKAENGDILCGTIDTWLIWKLTEGKIHATDVSNASRTMLFNLYTQQWDEELLKIFSIPRAMLPQIKNSADYFGTTKLFGAEIPICGVAGDQQAALFGQQCFTPGSAKNTYGTGCFMLMHTGDKIVHSSSGLLTTVAWKINDTIQYALEGSVFIAGAAVQWLRDQLQIIQASAESEILAASLENNGDVYFIPAFTGMGAPHWNMHAKGTITGLTRGTGKTHIVRAALESIAYQTKDVFDAMEKDAGIHLKELKADGGASANNWLMQFQSDILQVPVVRSQNIEATATGAAMFAGIGAGLFSMENINSKEGVKVFIPSKKPEEIFALHGGWKNAVKKLLP